MRRLPKIFLLAMALEVAAAAAAAESELVRRLDEALGSVIALEYGKDTGRARDVEGIVFEASANAEVRGAVEERLLGALRSASTSEARSFLCRQLRTIGSGAAVPELEKLLTDPELSHMARYALLGIKSPEAVAALRRALDRTSGKLQVGIVNTLANRRCREAMPNFMRLLRSPDSGVAGASARALGRVGGAEAVRALEAARSRSIQLASKSLRRSIDNALLVCADGFLADGKAYDAARIYERFYSPDQPKHLRLAGLRGLAAARGPRAVPLLVEAIKSGDPYLQRNAISFMALVKGEGATGALVSLLTSLPSEAQALLLNALGARRDAAAVRAISQATKSPNEAVRLAALEALSRAGDESAVGVLSRAAATAGGREGDVARAGLLRLRGDNVDAAIMQSIGSGYVKVRVELIRALAGRKVTKAAGVLLVTADDDDETVRREAIRALGAVARESDLPALMRRLVKPKEAGDRAAVGQAIASLFRRIEDKTSQARPVLDALRYAPDDAKPALVRLLGRPATPAAYEAVRGAVESARPALRDAAVRTLSEWPDPTPAADLLRVARTSAEGVHKVLALRGYVRMAGMSDDPTAMYVRAMDLAERPEDKKLVLGGLGTADSAEALAIAERYLGDNALQAEAALAAVQIATRLKASDAARAKAALKKIVEVTEGRVRKQAQDAINEMEQYEGYILAWVAAGPYSQKGKDSRVIFDTAYPPEKPDAADVKWKRITKGIDAWGVNLEAQFGSRDHCGAYVRTRVRSPKEADARLELGSDDAIKAWLGGKLVHSNYSHRGMTPRQDIAKIKLKEGWNDLMLKVVDHEGGWAFCCRLRAADGSALDGLRFEAR